MQSIDEKCSKKLSMTQFGQATLTCNMLVDIIIFYYFTKHSKLMRHKPRIQQGSKANKNHNKAYESNESLEVLIEYDNFQKHYQPDKECV
jgi:hypothetical protein